MCRWFAYLSPAEPCLLSDVLIRSDHSITKQVNSHYLPYLIPHQLAPLDQVENIQAPFSGPIIPTSAPAPSPALAPAITSEDPAQHALRLRNLALNDDGHGIVWYTDTAFTFEPRTDGRPRLAPIQHRSTLPLSNSANFASLAENTATTCLLAHVRAGSGAPISELNCHPFLFGNYSFMHNGGIGGFDQIRRRLLNSLDQKYFDLIHGSTDSEVLGALIYQNIMGFPDPADERRAMERAVVMAFGQVVAAQREILGKLEPSSLNICMTDGTAMVATRFRNAGEEPPSLYWSRTAGVTLNQRYVGNPDGSERVDEELEGLLKPKSEHGKHVIVASEPSTFVEEEWALMERNTLLFVDDDGNLTMRKFDELGQRYGVKLA